MWCPLTAGDTETPDSFTENETDDGLDEGFVDEEWDYTIPPLPNSNPTAIIPGNTI